MKRDHISDRAERDGVEGLGWIKLAGKRPLLQGTQQFVCHAAGRQAVEGVWTIGLLGIDERIHRRSLESHLMMIGHDQSHSRRPAPRNGDGVRPTIAGDHEACAPRIELVQRLEIEAVALGESIGNVGDDIGADRA